MVKRKKKFNKNPTHHLLFIYIFRYSLLLLYTSLFYGKFFLFHTLVHVDAKKKMFSSIFFPIFFDTFWTFLTLIQKIICIFFLQKIKPKPNLTSKASTYVVTVTYIDFYIFFNRIATHCFFCILCVGYGNRQGNGKLQQLRSVV